MALLSAHTFRCRTCGVLPDRLLLTRRKELRRVSVRFLAILGALVAAEAAAALVLAIAGHGFAGPLSTMLVFTGAWLVVFGGIPGAASDQYSPGSYRDEAARRFSSAGEPASRAFILLGLGLLGLGYFLAIARIP